MSVCIHPSSHAPYGSGKNYELICDYCDRVTARVRTCSTCSTWRAPGYVPVPAAGAGITKHTLHRDHVPLGIPCPAECFNGSFVTFVR